MSLFGRIEQVAYVTADIRAAMEFHRRAEGIGPWFFAEGEAFELGRFEGAACITHLSVAIADVGGTQIELIQQHDDRPSVFQPFMRRIRAGAARLTLHHHVCMWPVDYDAKLAAAGAAGWQVAQGGATPRGRFDYLAHKDDPDRLIEFSEASPARRAFNAAIARAALYWDGSDPVRPFAAADAEAAAALDAASRRS